MIQDNYSLFETKFGDNAVISFDLFDTLVEKPFFQHSDLFEIMSSEVDKIVGRKNFDFKKIRILAEKFALKNKQNSDTTDLNDIYSEIKKLTNLSSSYIMEIEKLELCYEQKFYQPKIVGKQIYELAQSLNKKIIIIAESYLPRFFIEGLLERSGYTGYHELFISSELGLSKKTGTIFPFVVEKMFCDAKYFLHIGDNELEDDINPQKAGFNTIPILSSLESYTNSFYYKNIWENTEKDAIFSTRLINGLCAINFYKTRDNKSLNSEKSAFNQDAYRLGYFGIGPILLSYIQWILQKSQEDYVKHLYFLSTNGKFIKTAYDMLSKHYSQAPISYELLSSSRICNIPKMLKSYELYSLLDEKFEDISISQYFSNNFNYDITEHKLSLEKYGLSLDSIINQEKNEKQIFSFFEEILPSIQNKTEYEKDYYSAYLKYNNLPNPDKSVIVDIGYNENIQSTLSEIAKQKIGGYYLVTFIDTIEKIKKNGMPISGYLGNFKEKKHQENSLETIFQSIEQEFITFELNGNTLNPVFLGELHSKNKKQFMIQAQNAALDFIADFDKTYNKHIPQFYFSPKQAVKPILYFLNQKNESGKVFKNFNVDKQHITPTKVEVIPQENIIKDDDANNGIFKAIGRIFLEIKKAL